MINIIAVIDAELAEKPGKLRRFPNLACMKISGYHKNKGDKVILKQDYSNLQNFDTVYISKVFTKTNVPNDVLSLPNVQYGGTGFFYDKAPALAKDIEHHFPDYSLYNDYVAEQLQKGTKPSCLKCFKDYSIGFLTRGCFRACNFCVNKKYDRCVTHSPLEEFYDAYEKNRKKIMLLDDNILAHPNWQTLLENLCGTNRKFCFKQGVDIRLITPTFAKLIDGAKHDGELFFAFDNIDDASIIERKLSMFREYSDKGLKIYLLCGYDRNNIYDNNFWLADIECIFERLAIIGKYQAMPYLTRYEKYLDSPFAGLYKSIGTYCNFGGIFKVISFSQFCENEKPGSRWRYYNDFVAQYPHFETRFFNTKYWMK